LVIGNSNNDYLPGEKPLLSKSAYISILEISKIQLFLLMNLNCPYILLGKIDFKTLWEFCK